MNQKYREHRGPVKSIVWMDDDTGFISAGRDDHQIILWRLKPKIFKENDPNRAKPGNLEEEGKVKIWSHKQGTTQFFDCQVREEDPDKNGEPKKIVVFTASRDGAIRELLEGRSRAKYETGYQYSQLRLMHGHKAFFAGVSNPNIPGAIHVITYPFADERRI